MKHRIRGLLKRQLFWIYKLGTRLGVHIVPVHYYSSIPDIIELEKTQSVWAKKSELPGLEVDLEQQVHNLRSICMPYQTEYEGNRAYRYAVDNAFGPGYGYVEAQALHGVIRHFKPKRVVEVGSGVSTWCMLAALKMNKEQTGNDFSITCIDPFPSKKLKALREIELIEKPVQTVGFEDAFVELGENDLLFIDSSHTVKPGGDVNHLVLEILPKLRAGVVVHFHDITLPYDYSRKVLHTFFHWTETSLLRAYLVNNDRAKIIFCQSYLHYECQEALRELFPGYNPQSDINGMRDVDHKPPYNPTDEHFPSSIYIQIQSNSYVV